MLWNFSTRERPGLSWFDAGFALAPLIGGLPLRMATAASFSAPNAATEASPIYWLWPALWMAAPSFWIGCVALPTFGPIMVPARPDALVLRFENPVRRALQAPRTWVSAIRATILSIPRGKVSTYADVAEAAGYPGYHRQVAQVLNRSGDGLPWHRVLGAGGQIKTSRETALDQRALLEMEGVGFKGRRVDMDACAHRFAVSKSRRSS